MCPECESAMQPDGGCFVCHVCGYSKCEMGEPTKAPARSCVTCENINATASPAFMEDPCTECLRHGGAFPNWKRRDR